MTTIYILLEVSQGSKMHSLPHCLPIFGDGGVKLGSGGVFIVLAGVPTLPSISDVQCNDLSGCRIGLVELHLNNSGMIIAKSCSDPSTASSCS